MVRYQDGKDIFIKFILVNFADNNGWADWSSVCSTACLVENKPLCSLLCSLFRVTKKYCFPAWIASERQSIKHKTKSRKCYFKCWLETEIKGFLCFLQRVFEAKKNNDANDKICMMEIGDVKIASKGYSLLLSGSIKVLIQSAWSLKCLPGKYVCLMYMRAHLLFLNFSFLFFPFNFRHEHKNEIVRSLGSH